MSQRFKRPVAGYSDPTDSAFSPAGSVLSQNRSVVRLRRGLLAVAIFLAAPANGLLSDDSDHSRVATQPGVAAVQVRAGLQRRLLNQISSELPAWIANFYAERAFQSAWLDAFGKPKAVVDQLVEILNQARSHGLRSGHYNDRAIRRGLATLRSPSRRVVADLVDMDILLTRSFGSLAHDLAAGRVSNPKFNGDLPRRPFTPEAELRRALFRGDVAAALEALVPKSADYRNLRQALTRYRQLSAEGNWQVIPNGPKLEPGETDFRLPALRKRLRRSGDYGLGGQKATTKLAGTRFDPETVAAVKRFQARHGLKVDGIVAKRTLRALNLSLADRIAQLEVNLERLRWLPRELGARYVWVNIPDYRLQLFEQGSQMFSMSAVVGRSDRPTPVMAAKMTHLVLSPYWHVPPTIAVEDKLPLLQENPYALVAQNIRVLRDGAEIDPAVVDWHAIDSSNFEFALRQDPGPRNALGGIKFIFPNRHAVYLHDTPDHGLFRRTSRAFSSGCVRVEHPYELASQLLGDEPGSSIESLRRIGRAGRERLIRLDEDVPVYLVYQTAWAEDSTGIVHFRRDIYNRDRALIQELISG